MRPAVLLPVAERIDRGQALTASTFLATQLQSRTAAAIATEHQTPREQRVGQHEAHKADARNQRLKPTMSHANGLRPQGELCSVYRPAPSLAYDWSDSSLNTRYGRPEATFAGDGRVGELLQSTTGLEDRFRAHRSMSRSR